MNNSDLVQYLKNHIGERIFLNANDQNPYVLESVEKDYILLNQIDDLQDSVAESFVIPLSAIVSVQQIEGLPGIIVYLVK